MCEDGCLDGEMRDNEWYCFMLSPFLAQSSLLQNACIVSTLTLRSEQPLPLALTVVLCSSTPRTVTVYSSTNLCSPNMCQVWSHASSIPTNIPVLPPRPFWTTNGMVSKESVSPLNEVEAVVEVWNQWSDNVETVFRQMNSQSDHLDVPVEDYIGWIARFSNHPPRPTLSPAEEARDGTMGVPHIALMRAHSRWEAFADELAETYTIMARELLQYKPRSDGAHAIVECDDGMLDFSKISLSASTSTLTQVKAVFSAMLGPGRSFHRAVGESEHRQMPVLSNEAPHVDGRVEEGSRVERPGGLSDLYSEERPRSEWGDEFLETLREINREMEEDDYRDLDLHGLTIEDHDMEG